MNVIVHEAVAPQIDAIVRQPGGTALLHGAVGVGKRTLALEIARRMNCEGCSDGTCRSCKMIAGSNHPDIITLAPNEKNSIGIEPVHELQHKLQYREYEAGGKRVVMITSADRLTLPAQNALLKTLEEPPVGTTMILTAESPSALLPTVLSRCTQVFVAPLSTEQIAGALKSLKPVEAAWIAGKSRGRIGVAIGYAADKTTLEADMEVVKAVEELLDEVDTFKRLHLAGKAAGNADQRSLYLRELAVQAATKTAEGQLAALQAVERLHERLKANVNPKTAFEAMAMELA